MENSDALDVRGNLLFMALVAFICVILLGAGFSMGKEKGLQEAAQQEIRRQKVREAEIQKERLMIQANCNKDKVKSANYAEICHINDMNLGGNR